MKELKFRAWDEKSKTMYYFTYNGLIGNCWAEIDSSVGCNDLELPKGEWWEIVNLLTTTHVIQMRFTGLKDKTDKEIYEGDIIKGTCHESTIEMTRKVYWDDEECGFCPFCWCSSACSYDACGPCGFDKSSIEVIGNIHKNPELLKEE